MIVSCEGFDFFMCVVLVVKFWCIDLVVNVKDWIFYKFISLFKIVV